MLCAAVCILFWAVARIHSAELRGKAGGRKRSRGSRRSPTSGPSSTPAPPAAIAQGHGSLALHNFDKRRWTAHDCAADSARKSPPAGSCGFRTFLKLMSEKATGTSFSADVSILHEVC
jgi:hypothetical protein